MGNDEIFIHGISGVLRVAMHELSPAEFDAFLGRVTLLLENVEEYLNSDYELKYINKN